MIEVRRAGAPSKAPTGDAQMGASGIEIRPRSDDPYYVDQRPIVSQEPTSPTMPEAQSAGLGDVVIEGAKGLARGTLGLAESIGGAGVEMAGQLATGAYDLARSSQAFPGMTPQQVAEMEAANAAQVPTANPLEGQGQVAQQVFQSANPALARDPQFSPEAAPYMTTDWGVPQLARLAGEAGEMAPNAAATIGAAVATGGLGPAGAVAGGAMGGGLEGLSEYQQVLDKGGSPEEALRAASIMGAGSSVLNAIPFVTYSAKFLPKSMQGAVSRSMLSFLAEGSTESMEGGVSAAARMEKLPKSQEEWATAFDKIKQGVIDESNVFLVAGLMGGGTALAAGGDPQAPSAARATPAVSPPPVAPQAPADRLEPGPNAPTPAGPTELFEDDFVPFDMPTTAPVEPTTDTTAPEPILPSIEQAEAVQAPVEQGAGQEPMSEEMRAILSEYPEVEAMLNATRNLTPEKEALEQMILGADTVDSREIPKVEIRRPVSREESLASLVEERPVLDVGRPLDAAVRPEEEGVPQGPSRATVRAQDRPRPGERPTATVPGVQARAKVRGPEPSRAVALANESRAIEAEPEASAPEAEFVGLQERPRGQAPIALYNIPDGNGGKTTVAAETAKERGFAVPEPPATPEAIRTAALEIGGQPETRVRLADLREKLGGTPEQQDATLKQMQTDGELVLMRNDDPQDIAPRDEAAKLMIGENRRDLVYLKPEKRKPTDESGFGSMDLVKIPGKLFSLAKDNAGPIEFKQGFGGAKGAVVKRRGKLKSLETRAILLQKDFENAYRTIYKRDNPLGKLTNRLQQVPDAMQQDINTYLEEKDPDAKAAALEALPPEMRKPAVRGRQLVDDLTDYLVSIGVVTDEQGVQFEEAKGSYLRRTYDAATDPDFKGRRDPRVVKATRDWLKKEYPNYNEDEITGIMTDLDGFGISEEATTNLIKRGGVLGKLDRNTLGKREDIPEAIQEYWGVSRRGIDRVMDTVNSQAHIIANYEFLSELADTLDGAQVATASTLRDIKRGTYTGSNADEIMSWPYLNDADRIRSVKKHSRNKEVTAKQKGLDEAIARVEKLPDSVKKREVLKQLKEDKAIQQRGLKRDKAGILSVDKDNLEAAADYIEQLTAQVSALRKGDDKAKQKRLRSELDKYTRQYNAAANEGATEAELPSMFGSFGPMAGARIHPDLKKALQDAMGTKESPEWVNALQMLNAQAKQNVTTRDPASAARNFQSGIDFGFANGWFLYDTVRAGKRMADALAIASVDFKRNHNPENREKYLRTTELGVTGDTAVVGDITATAKNAKKNPVARYIINKLPQTTTGLGKVDELATKIYQAGDDVFKVFGWLTETEHLMDAYGMPREQAEVEAAARVRRQFPTYSEIPRWTQSLKRFPIAGPFVAYQTETYRNTWNIMAQAVTEIKSDNPKVKAMGVRRAVGMLWAMTNRKAYLLAAAAIFGIDPDDDEARQMALPEFYQDHSVAFTEADKAKGIYKGYNISTMDAFNVVKEPVFAALRGDDTTEAAGNAAQALLKAYYSPELGTDLGAELITNWGGSSDSIFNASDGFFEKLFKSGIEAGGTFAVPGIARRHLKADTPEKQANEIFSSLTGFKQIEANMPDSLYWMARDVAAVPREQSRDVYKKLRANDKAGAEAEIASANKTRKERFTDLHKAFTAFRKAGTNETLLNDAMKRAGLSKAMIDAVKYNQYEDWQGSETIQEAMGK